MDFHDLEDEHRFRRAWNAVQIARPVRVSLFTFGETQLPYFLVCEGTEPGVQVSITRGEVRIKRPVIITPNNAPPDLEGFFDNAEEEGLAQFLLARSAQFSHLQFENQRGEKQFVSDNVDEVVDRLNRRLDDEDEDGVAILTAPMNLAGLAVLRYASERVLASAPGNIQELRERGFLP